MTNTPEADLMVRTGDIDNLNFGWPPNFDPFSGQSTPSHSYPWTIDPNDPDGTDRIMVVSSFNGAPPHGSDGYTSSTQRPDNSVQSIDLSVYASAVNINSAIIQMFVDDFQASSWGANYQVKLNGVRIPSIEEVINSLDQTGPIGKIVTVKIPEEYLYLLKSGRLSINIDDPETGAGDGFAIDFAKLLINPKQIARSGTVTGKVVSSSNNQPLSEVLVSAGGVSEVNTDESGSYTLTKVPAGLASVKAQKGGYDSQIKNIDVIADQTASLDFSLNSHPESTQNPIMTPTPQELAKWVALYENAPDAPGTKSETTYTIMQYLGASTASSFSLLPYLKYDPIERNQGDHCGDCWQWAGTAVMEIQLAYDKNIKDKLSIEYINSNIESSGDDRPCCGGWLDYLTKFYTDRGQAVPWTNSNADWQDGSCDCGKSVVLPDSTSTTPAYPIVSIKTEKVPTHGVGADTAINNIKTVLSQGKAVWFAFFLPNQNEWDKFHNFWKNQPEDAVYQMDSASGTPYAKAGGHAVVIVGYDETDPNNRYWIVLNSWGTAKGLRPNGLFRVNMDMNYDCQYPGFNRNYALFFETLDVTYSDRVKPNSGKIKPQGKLNIDITNDVYTEQDPMMYYCINSNGVISYLNRIYLIGPDLDKVAKVTYVLHPTFPNPEITSEDPSNDFGIEIMTWGRFQMKAIITTKSGQVFEKTYDFSFKSKVEEALAQGIPQTEDCEASFGSGQMTRPNYGSSRSITASNNGLRFSINTYTGESTYAQCQSGDDLQLILNLLTSGSVEITEIYPDGTPINSNFYYPAGKSYHGFVADTPGRHELYFKINNQKSNSIVIDVV